MEHIHFPSTEEFRENLRTTQGAILAELKNNNAYDHVISQ